MITFEKIWFTYTLVAWGWFFLGCIITDWLDFFLDLSYKASKFCLNLIEMPLMVWITLEAFYFILKLILYVFGINLDLFPSITW